REERPDIDNIYMTVCQALTGRGGWPLSIFMTPEAKPFYAGTYFPKTGRMGMPGLMDILIHIASLWEKERSSLISDSEKITDLIRPKPDSKKSSHSLGDDTLKMGYENLKDSFDSINGGFGSQPKFPTPHQLTFLLRWHKRNPDSGALKMVEKTLEAMRRGGIFDQIGFGFHRYSVDAKWLVPHFEKMLYDQALLAMAYTEAFQVTGKDNFSETAKEIFTYVLRDMAAPEGGFYSAEDADSEGKEGLFYIWTPKEVERHLGKDPGELICRFYGITEEGNFEDGDSIAHVPVSHKRFAESEGISLPELETTLESAREKLFNVRKQRIHPLKDDKILTSWNGLMIAAFAKGYQVFGDRAYADAAKGAADFILKKLKTKDGRLLRRYRQGDAAYPAYLDDYAFMVWGLIELYEATFEVAWLEEAVLLNKSMMDIYWDIKDGGLFFTGEGNETLIMRSKEIYDGAIPSGNSVAALNLLRLGRMTGNVDLEQKAEQLINTFAGQVTSYPAGYTQLLAALDFVIGPGKEVVIAGDTGTEATQSMVRTIQNKFLPNKVVLLKHQGAEGQRLANLSPFVEAMGPVNRKPTVYICEQYTCKSPISDISELEKVLK
ncbi:MAG: thioredoxin domain-containing protein, partial [Deltaproteobacteria bacterium]|nr:thioredoxin domain-containing protein [Deltaproteobacteria bacterium]